MRCLLVAQDEVYLGGIFFSIIVETLARKPESHTKTRRERASCVKVVSC